MKLLERLILLAGFATLAVLLWKFDAHAVWRQVAVVGWGFAAILPFQILDHSLNAVGWRFCFAPKDASRAPFWRLFAVRVAGDGVNYLTPSATIAGELVRPAMLGGALSGEIRNSSVVVAKFAQAMGQALFILIGMLFLLHGPLDILTGRFKAGAFAAVFLPIAFLSSMLLLLVARGKDGELRWKAQSRFSSLRQRMGRYLESHPGRFALSTSFFCAGYAWGALEVLLICRFMGVSISPAQAFAVETFSNIVDSLMFMVPAKVGTQEAGKTAIFRALGYSASTGLAFGLIRHLREFAWAAAGFLLYVVTRRRISARSREPLPSRTGPAPSADSAGL